MCVVQNLKSLSRSSKCLSPSLSREACCIVINSCSCFTMLIFNQGIVCMYNRVIDLCCVLDEFFYFAFFGRTSTRSFLLFTSSLSFHHSFHLVTQQLFNCLKNYLKIVKMQLHSWFFSHCYGNILRKFLRISRISSIKMFAAIDNC